MHAPILRFTVFLSMATLVACSSRTTETASAEQDSTAADTRTEKADMIKQDMLSDVADGYLKIKNALVASEFEQAHAGSVELLGVVNATEMPDVQQRVKEMANMIDPEAQIVYFDSLSVALYEYLQRQSGNHRTLYKQYCPMAFDNRGAFWLSSSEEIKNPYFGDKMLHCGQVEEEVTF